MEIFGVLNHIKTSCFNVIRIIKTHIIIKLKFNFYNEIYSFGFV